MKFSTLNLIVIMADLETETQFIGFIFIPLAVMIAFFLYFLRLILNLFLFPSPPNDQNWKVKNLAYSCLWFFFQFFSLFQDF